MTAIDVHQHLWPERLLSALAARRHPPRLVRAPAGWELLLGAEPPSLILPTDHDPERRAQLVREDGLDGALIALSSPLGIESLPTGEAEPLLEAYHEGAQALGAPFGWWGAVALDRPQPDAVDRLLAAGAAGISMPAGALASPRGLDRVGPLLERVERHGAPLFVHPGPAPWRPMAWSGSAFPGWWPALTAYVTQLHEAWHAWMAWGRDAAPAAHGRLGDARRRRAAPCRAAGRARRAGDHAGQPAGGHSDAGADGVLAVRGREAHRSRAQIPPDGKRGRLRGAQEQQGELVATQADQVAVGGVRSRRSRRPT